MFKLCLLFVFVVLAVCIPSEFDWKVQNPDCAAPVQNQGNCGNSYEIDLLSIASEYACKNGLFVNSSQALSGKYAQACCSAVYGPQYCGGCSGSAIDGKITTFLEKIGTVTESCYGSQTGCPSICADGVEITERYTVKLDRLHEISDIEESIYTSVPVVTGIDANTLLFYTGGIVTCKPTDNTIDDTVMLVGWGSENGVDYWIGQNTWGVNWGNSGFFKIRRGQNDCAVESIVERVTVALEKN